MFNAPPDWRGNERLPGEGPVPMFEIVVRYATHIEIEGPFTKAQLGDVLDELEQECPEAKVSVLPAVTEA